MHTMSKLSTIAASATLLAALSAFGAATDPSGLTLVDLTSPDGNITSSNPKDANSNNTGPETAFSDDGNRFLIYSKDIYKDGGAVDIVYEFTEATVVTAYGIYNHIDYNPDARAPNTWTFSGSNDGSTWTELDAQNAETGWTASEFRFYYFGNKGSFTHYKIEITSNNSNEYTQFGTMEFYNVNLADAVPISFGEPSFASDSTSVSVSQPYTLREGATVTGVSLFVGESADSLSVSTVVPEFSDGVASFGLENLSSHATYFWQLKFAITYYEASNDWTSDVAEVITRRVATFVGENASYGAAESWNIGVVPRDVYTDIVIDGDENTVSEATLTIPYDDNTWNAGSALITAGDTFKITNRGNDNKGGTFTANYQSITNRGTLRVSTSASGNGQDVKINCVPPGAFYNAEGAVILIANTSSRNQCDPTITIGAEGSANDGTIYLTQQASNRNRVHFIVNGTGLFVNNGLIRGELIGSYENSDYVSYANVQMSGIELSGVGKIFLDEEKRTGTISNSRLTISGTAVLTNGVSHTIMGSGSVGNGALCNAGLVLATNSMGYALFVQNTIRDSNGKPIENLSTGRIVAANAGGLYLGANDAKARNSQFINSGLLEARSGSFIAFRTGVTEQGGKNTIATTTPMNQGGRWAGGGEFRIPRPLTLTENSVIAPGDLANTLAEDGETVVYGTGESTCGTLTFTNSLTMSSGTVSEFQFAKKDEFDSLHVGGTLKIDGTLKIVGKPHGGTFRMITSDNPITSDNEKIFAAIDLSAAEGGSKPRLKYVEDEQNGIYYIEATFGDGFSIIIR